MTITIPLFAIIVIILAVALITGILVGSKWMQEKYLPKITKVKKEKQQMVDELNYYRTRNHSKYPGKGIW